MPRFAPGTSRPSEGLNHHLNKSPNKALFPEGGVALGEYA